ncbi:Fc receptor-like protein 3 isoform X1 [Sardina pilchardus]|uniref:Fc receptor-like protein 3 isoform X1 n=1 Tax=Sardina pilchardus TaxID=27697 RepID=UPI002E1625D8
MNMMMACLQGMITFLAVCCFICQNPKPVAGVYILSDPPSKEIFEGMTLRLVCNITKGSHVSYKWFFNGKPLGDATPPNTLTIHNTTVNDSGGYVCIGSSTVNNISVNLSNSSKTITIKEIVSVPSVSFTVVKESSGNFSARITCRSFRGTPPITFTLLNNSQKIGDNITKHLSLTFIVPIYLDQHMGTFICQAWNGYINQNSFPMHLQAETVGGASMTTYEHMDDNFQVTGLELCCQVERGTFPHYIWFHNNTPLTMRGRSHVLSADNSTLFFTLDPSIFGEFHCQAFNSFDKTIRISSQRRLINKEASNRLPVMVVAVVFGCFCFVAVVLTSCCFYGIYKLKHNKDIYNFSTSNGWSAEMDERKCIAKDKDFMKNTAEAKEVAVVNFEGEYCDDWPKIEEPN